MGKLNSAHSETALKVVMGSCPTMLEQNRDRVRETRSRGSVRGQGRNGLAPLGRFSQILMLLFAAGMKCLAATHYVVPTNSASTAPYTNWATAGTNMIDVVNTAMTNAAPRIVRVSNGTYYLTNQVQITNALTLQSINGRDVTVINGNYPNNTNRCLYIVDGGILDGFTVTNAHVIDKHGGGIFAQRGVTIRNCRITGCSITNSAGDKTYYGGGVYIDGNVIMTDCEVIGNVNYAYYGGGIYGTVGVLVSNCVVAENRTYASPAYEAYGAGILIWFGVVDGCKVYGNTAGGGPNFAYSGGIQANEGSTVRNTLVYNNSAHRGGGITTTRAGTIRNCTIVSNVASVNGGGLYLRIDNGKTACVENVISYFNTGCDSSNIYCRIESPSCTGLYYIVNSCIAPTNDFPTSGIEGYYYAGNIESDAQFVNKDANNWRLQANSPCVNTGTNQEWMTNSVDLDGRQRIRYGTVDIGAYETIYNGTIYRFGQ